MVALTLLLGCDGPTRTIRVPVGPTEEENARLGAAVKAVNTTRAAALAGPGVVVEGATALDGADEACATGQRGLAGQARSRARAAVPGVRGALTRLPQQVTAYRVALAELTAAGQPLEAAERSALADVGVAGEAEATALADFGTAATRIWPAYAELDDAQSTWLDRASAGWFRDQREAASAYVVLRKPLLPRLDEARTALAQADAATRPATERMRSALAAADQALEGLRAPAG